jgi:uncharacterized cupredoxin-like copper-binding protein
MNKLLIPSLIVIGLTATALAQADAGHPAKDHSRQGSAATVGQPGDAKKVSRTIEVTMTDNMRFNPSSITVKRGETVRFVAKNLGKLKHEMVLGDTHEIQEHAALMRKFPEMEHADPNQVSVDPGKTGDLIWRFTQAGTFDFACLQPGHFEAGMVGKMVVKR